MTMIDVILSVVALSVFACGFIGGYVLCYRKWQMDKAQWLADARRLANYNDQVYREAVGFAPIPSSGPSDGLHRRDSWPYSDVGRFPRHGYPSAQRERGGIL